MQPEVYHTYGQIPKFKCKIKRHRYDDLKKKIDGGASIEDLRLFDYEMYINHYDMLVSELDKSDQNAHIKTEYYAN